MSHSLLVAMILFSVGAPDRRARAFDVPFEFDAFVFWAWPVVVPYYLYRSRGGRGLLLALSICGLYRVPYWAGMLVHLILRK